MNYSVLILPKAEKGLSSLPDKEYRRMKAKIQDLQTNPRPPGCIKLAGRQGWRLRVGDYRVVYEIDDSQRTIRVVLAGHRRDVYR